MCREATEEVLDEVKRRRGLYLILRGRFPSLDFIEEARGIPVRLHTPSLNEIRSEKELGELCAALREIRRSH